MLVLAGLDFLDYTNPLAYGLVGVDNDRLGEVGYWMKALEVGRWMDGSRWQKL